jgi:hypothetical protein
MMNYWFVLTTAFVILKVADVIDWAWYWILSIPVVGWVVTYYWIMIRIWLNEEK